MSSSMGAVKSQVPREKVSMAFVAPSRIVSIDCQIDTIAAGITGLVPVRFVDQVTIPIEAQRTKVNLQNVEAYDNRWRIALHMNVAQKAHPLARLYSDRHVSRCTLRIQLLQAPAI